MQKASEAKPGFSWAPLADSRLKTRCKGLRQGLQVMFEFGEIPARNGFSKALQLSVPDDRTVGERGGRTRKDGRHSTPFELLLHSPEKRIRRERLR